MGGRPPERRASIAQAQACYCWCLTRKCGLPFRSRVLVQEVGAVSCHSTNCFSWQKNRETESVQHTSLGSADPTLPFSTFRNEFTRNCLEALRLGPGHAAPSHGPRTASECDDRHVSRCQRDAPNQRTDGDADKRQRSACGGARSEHRASAAMAARAGQTRPRAEARTAAADGISRLCTDVHASPARGHREHLQDDAGADVQAASEAVRGCSCRAARA